MSPSKIKITEITYGYDRHERLWCVICHAENACDDFTEWMPEKRHCELFVEEMRREYPKAKVIKYKAY